METVADRSTWTLDVPGGRQLRLGARPKLMGILNLTPDSFSDGGLWTESSRAVEHALAMDAAGAEILDLGAESTRPGGGVYGDGAIPVSVDEELERLLPVLETLRPLTRAILSVDTRKGTVARQALAAGADLVNDVSAMADPEMRHVVAEAGCPIVLMHSRGSLRSMQRRIAYDDVLAEVHSELGQSMQQAIDAGISERQIVLDPGIGFGKTYEQNLTLLRHLSFFGSLGRPLLVGASRKSFIGHLSGAAPEERLGGSLAAAAWACAQSAAILRVHDVAETAELLDVWLAIDRQRTEVDR